MQQNCLINLLMGKLQNLQNCTVLTNFQCLQVAADEVCGCPLLSEKFKETGQFCRIAKKKCNKHPGWEMVRRAEIDLEKLRQVSCLLLSAISTVLQNYGQLLTLRAIRPTHT